MLIKTPPTQANPGAFASIREMLSPYRYDRSIWMLIIALFALSLLAGGNFERSMPVYVAGEVAEQNVIAERDMQVEDTMATQARREQIISWQPPVFDLSGDIAARLHKAVLHLFMEINETDPEKVTEKKNATGAGAWL